jgi:hypothetical protein
MQEIDNLTGQPINKPEKDRKSFKAIWGTVLAFILPIGIAGIVLYFVFYPEYENWQIIENGVQAEGVILSAEKTGSYYNDDPQIRFMIEVNGEDGTFESEAKMIISEYDIPKFQPGARVRIFYDPENKERSAIEQVEIDGPKIFPDEESDTITIKLTKEEYKDFQQYLKKKDAQEE